MRRKVGTYLTLFPKTTDKEIDSTESTRMTQVIEVIESPGLAQKVDMYFDKTSKKMMTYVYGDQTKFLKGNSYKIVPRKCLDKLFIQIKC